MAIKTYKPTTPSRRFMTNVDNSDITAKASVRSLLTKLTAHAGRNNNGRITSRHKEAGAKKLYRIIDFKRNKFGVAGTVAAIEYDPYRNCRIALVNYADGDKRYILQPKGMVVGDSVAAAESGLDIKSGNAMKLMNIPVGTTIHNIELKPGKGGQIVRSAGTSAKILAKEGNYITLRLPSKEIRLIRKECFATVGELSNNDAFLIQSGKAGRTRWLGKRPTVRGSVMNPCDHPHGGGEGRTPIGRTKPLTPWGKPALGKKTRRTKKLSNSYILRRRS